MRFFKKKNGEKDKFYLLNVYTGEKYKLIYDSSIVGRDKSICNLVLDDVSVSRNHAQLVYKDAWYIEDCGSLNGTYVNGTRINMIESVRLNCNDKLSFGNVTLLFTKEDEKAETDKTNSIECIESENKRLDRIKGSLVGGAIGDALGYPVEFFTDKIIFEKYGEKGITNYKLRNGIAEISDDTQMTLFTANAILFGDTRAAMRGIGGDPRAYAPQVYLDWYMTQTLTYEEGCNSPRYNGKGGLSWLLDVPELYERRAPGNTCLSSLRDILHGVKKDNYIEEPMNDSKGCGGIMRIAPIGLHYRSKSNNILLFDMISAELSAITHGHSLGYMPSAVLTHILNRIVYPINEKNSLKEIVMEACSAVKEIFKDDKNIDKLTNIVNYAIKLSCNNASDIENIRLLGEGWVAEETLAIAVYCSLKYENDFSKGIIAAVNHSGDSDSTGAVTGNILGAINGYNCIEDKWKNNLELHDVLIEMAEDLCYGCRMSEYSEYNDEVWTRKYIDIHWDR